MPVPPAVRILPRTMEQRHEAGESPSVRGDLGTAPLRLVSVLSAGLPITLGTPEAPRSYTVPAVFSRRVSADERAVIESPQSARMLAAAGFPWVTLAVSDRRLLVGGTSVEQLGSGLAHELAVMLRGIGHRLDAERAQRQPAARVLTSAEEARVAGVQHLVDAIAFE